jgi:hypothetical protein
MSNTKNEEKKFNTTIVPLWTTQNGNMFSMVVGPEHFDALQQVEIGGKLFIKMLPEDRRKSEKSPNAYLEYVSKEDVAKYKEQTKGRTSRGNTDSL